jgi:hypothetical protein
VFQSKRNAGAPFRPKKDNPRGPGSPYPPRSMRRFLAAGALLVAVFVLGTGRAEAAPAKKRKKPTATPTATPTPLPLRKAAGSVVGWVPGKHVVVAEVGSAGRVFQIDGETQIEASLRTGTRVRILWFDGPAGPVARQILPGPTLATPTPAPKKN